MNVILIGGGETIETVYFLGKLFARRGYKLTIVTPSSDDAKMLSRRVEAIILLGDGSSPAVLEAAGARRADVLLSLAPYDPDNLVACQVAQRLFKVPRTLALINDPDNEEVFHRLGVTEVFSATRMIGSIIEGQTVFDEITHLFPAAEGRLRVTEIVLGENAPAIGKSIVELDLPKGSLITSIIRGDDVLVPRDDSHLQAADRLLLVGLPENQVLLLHTLTGEGE